MTATHEFIFKPGRWIGEGKISFSASGDHLHFYTSWMIVKEEDSDVAKCEQQVVLQGNESAVINQYSIEKTSSEKFNIQLENELFGYVEGNGIISELMIAWEFRNGNGVEGFEVYELQENGDYMLHAEYISPDQFRTIIEGRIWSKTNQVISGEH